MTAADDTRVPLFVPADRPERYVKAAATETDMVIIDLEDAVAAEAKDRGRAALNVGFTSLPVAIRINAVQTPWHQADLEVCRELSPAAVVLPKTENGEDLIRILTVLGGSIPLIALIETGLGLANARAIATVPGVRRLAFGSIDFCADLGCAHTHDALLPARHELVLASRLAGIAPPLDGVTVQIKTPGAAYEDALNAKKLGMGGKLCIHPSQIAEVKSAYTPTEEERDWAQRVLDLGDGTGVVDGAMVDEPVRARARRILAV